MIFWILTESGRAIKLEDQWTHSFYVASDNLKGIAKNKELAGFIKGIEITSKYERLTDRVKSELLKITLADSRKAEMLANRIWQSGDYGQFRLYNVDLLPAQSYFYEHDLFPLAFCKVKPLRSRLQWEVQDDVWLTDYRLPDFRTIRLDIKLQREGRLPSFTDRIKSVSIKKNDDDTTIDIEKQSEAEIIQELISTVTELDPDFVLLHDGDAFVFPYLIRRAEMNGIDLLLNREKLKVSMPSYEGTSYVSYGKIHFKPATVPLLGRIHLDFSNSFVYDESGMQGFFEVARICRMPLHTAFRASIGKCLSSLQFYHAIKNDRLVPWKPDEAEHFKTLEELLLADRGGLILVPMIGVHEKVAEFDFVSLYPNIMYKKNVSAETISCNCCIDSDRRVPELNFNTCKQRTGIVPTALEIVIKKRSKYKQLKKAAKDSKSKAIYDSRQNALKWINVTSFGYLGFNNAKFGRIDSHQAVCAYDRQTLLRAVKVAEKQGFRVLHGIVDSLWVQKRDASDDDYLKLKQDIEDATGFEISFEGEYNWVVFLPSKRNEKLPVPNRYFGVFTDGSIKVRGLEARRHDTPPLFSKFQQEALKIMAKGKTIHEVKALMPEVKNLFNQYVLRLKEGRVLLEELMFTKQLSKDSDQFENRNTAEISSIHQLSEEGKPLKAGQVLRYIVTDYYQKKSKQRTVPEELIDGRTTYDAKRYVELLAETCNSITEPFGYELQINEEGQDLMGFPYSSI